MSDLEIDRIAPTRRPDARPAGSQRWESLLFCHWEVPTSQLRQLVPADLELDTWEGRAFVGIVPFKMRNIRPWWLPGAFSFNFLETNVRTYVVHRGRPGVYFFSLDASSMLAVWAAKIGWSLPYYYAAMSSDEDAGRIGYESSRHRGAACHQAHFRIGNQLGPSPPNTLEFFLFERYLLFVQRGGGIYCGQVHHPPYDVWTADLDSLEDSLLTAAGLSPEQSMPQLSHYSPGVDVDVFAIERV